MCIKQGINPNTIKRNNPFELKKIQPKSFLQVPKNLVGVNSTQHYEAQEDLIKISI